MTEVTTCFDSGFRGPRITDATLCKVYFTLHSDFTDSKSCYLQYEPLFPQQTVLSISELQTLKLYRSFAFWFWCTLIYAILFRF